MSISFQTVPMMLLEIQIYHKALLEAQKVVSAVHLVALLVL